MATNILVIEDSLPTRKVLVGVVEKIGYRALQADSGEAGLELFATNSVDIVVLDVQLPGMDGFETCRKIREASGDDWLPVIYLSATHSDEYIVEGLEAGGDAYVTKPVNHSVLEAILKAMGRIAHMKNQLARANKELMKLANHDGLTKILNRRGFDEVMDRYWRQAQRDQSEIGLLLIDIDHFKAYNDTYGHVRGDETLTAVAHAIEKALMRPIDIAARYGGEEFAVLLPSTGMEGAMTVGDRILDVIRDEAIPHLTSPVKGFLTVSIGVALSSGLASAGDLIKRADAALYQAKERGRNRVNIV